MDSTFMEEVERLFAAYEVPPAERQDILQVSLLQAVYRWERIRDPKTWILGQVRIQIALWKGLDPENE